jgi:release factor glutamine methyltransferase
MTAAKGCPSRQLISEAVAALRAAGIENPGLDAEVMLAAATHNSRAAVVAGLGDLDDSVRACYTAMISRRAHREPLAYILGCKEFYSLEFEVTPAVLIPRPETETVVNAALEFITAHGSVRVLDIGTGSGAIALAIAANALAAQVLATDISVEALAIAQHNAVRLQLGAQVRFRLADCFEPMDDLGQLGRVDLIVSNPPYIEDGEIARLAPEIRRYEPRAALAGGYDGLDFYRRIAPALAAHLDRSGAAIFEIGWRQSTAVAEILRNASAINIKVIADLAGLLRVVVAYFR